MERNDLKEILMEIIMSEDFINVLNVSLSKSNKIHQKKLLEWYKVSDIAELRGLTPDAIRKQLYNGDFEDGVDFKKKGSRIKIHQGAIERIERKRSSNG